MPTAVDGEAQDQLVHGRKRCSITGATVYSSGMLLGPDGDNWELYSLEEMEALQVAQYRHLSRNPIDHLCAGMGGRAFKVSNSSMPQSVVFLHLQPPSKFDRLRGDGGTTNLYSPNAFRRSYEDAVEGSRSPLIWRRNTGGMDEIAINFCLKHY